MSWKTRAPTGWRDFEMRSDGVTTEPRSLVVALAGILCLAGWGPDALAAGGRYHIIKLDTGVVRKGQYEFTYENIMHPELDWLRQTEGLDEVVAGARTEFEMITRLAAWTAEQWMYGGYGGSGKNGTEILARIHQGLGQGRVCGSYNLVFADALLSFGIQPRFLNIGTDEFVHPQTKKKQRYWHAVGDVWSNDYQKWVYMDGNFACYFEDGHGIPQSIFDLQQALLTGNTKGIRLVFCGEYARSTAPIFERYPHFRDDWFPTTLRDVRIFYNLDMLMANNVHDPKWHSSGKGPKGEKLGPMRLYYKPNHPGFSPFFFDTLHYEVTDDVKDVTWNLYDVEIGLERTGDMITGRQLPLRMKTFAPFLETFLVRMDGGQWREVPATRVAGHDAELGYIWALGDGLNTFEVRVRNTRGRLGVVRGLRVSNDPLSMPPTFVKRAGGAGMGSVVFSAKHQGFFAGPSRGGAVRLDAKQPPIQLQGPDGAPIAPSKFCIDEQGCFIAACGHTIHKFDSTGKHLLSFGSEGSGKGQFRDIGGVAVGADGTIYVSDAHYHEQARVQVFDSQGSCLRVIGRYGARPGELNLPSGIAISAAGSVFVVDSGNHRIPVFATGGKLLRQIGPEVRGYGRLRFPSGICVGRHGKRELLYIVDTFNHQVVITELDGKLVGSFGGYSPVAKPGKFLQPRSIAAHGGRVYVLQPPVIYEFRHGKEEEGVP